MNFVEPIRDLRKIAAIKNLLVGQRRYRDLLLITIGINTALRISDLLNLRVGDVLDPATEKIRDRFWLREEKRNKRNEVVINDSIREALRLYFQAYTAITDDPQSYLFFSGKQPQLPIQRMQAWRIITEMCEAVGLQGNFGTHTLRKTWGYHARRNGVDLALIMAKLNHSSLHTTKRYLGITDEEIGDVVRRLNL